MSNTENNRNWPGVAALILAGLALLVALGGRGGPNFDFSGHIWNGASPPNAGQVAPVAKVADQGAIPAVPQPPAPPPAWAQAQAEAQARIAQAAAEAQAKIAQADAKARSGPFAKGPPAPGFAGKFGHGFEPGPGGPGRFASFFLAPFRLLGSLVQLLFFGAVLFFIFRAFRHRRPQAPQPARGPGAPPPPPAAPPPGPRPTVKL